LTGDVKGAVDVMEERLTEVKVMKQMELTETTRKLGKCTEVKSWSRWSSIKPLESLVQYAH
jgi:hypothetical protein